MMRSKNVWVSSLRQVTTSSSSKQTVAGRLAAIALSPQQLYHSSATHYQIENVPQLPTPSSLDPLNRSALGIRENLLYLLTPTWKDQIDLQSALYDLERIAEPYLTAKFFEEHIVGKEHQLSAKELTLAINCLDKVHKVPMVLDLYHNVTKNNPTILSELSLIALLRAVRQSETGAREGLAIYKAALKDNEHYPQLAYNPKVTNYAIVLCYNVKMTPSSTTNGIDEALSIKEMLDQVGASPHSTTFGLLISVATHFQRYVVAKTLYKEYVELYQMPVGGAASSSSSSSAASTSSSIFVETAMTSAALRAKDFVKCYELAQKISKLSKMSTDPYAACTMLAVFMQTQDWRIGMEIIERLLKDDTKVDAVLAKMMKRFLHAYMQSCVAAQQQAHNGGNVDSVLAKEELESLWKRAVSIQNTLFNEVMAQLDTYDSKEADTVRMLIEYADLIASRGWMGRVVTHLLVNDRPSNRLAHFIRAAAGKLGEQQMDKELLSLLERALSYEEDLDASNVVVVTVLGNVIARSYVAGGSSAAEEDIQYWLTSYLRRKEDQLADPKCLKALVTPLLKYNEVDHLHHFVSILRQRGTAISEDTVNSWVEQRTSLRNNQGEDSAVHNIPSVQQLDVL